MKKNFVFLIAIFAVLSFTQAQVVRISNDTELQAGYPINATLAIFISGDHSLYVTDGSEANTAKLDIPVKLEVDSALGVLNGKFYFSGIDAANEAELWVTDGTADGTLMVKNINPGTASSSPKSFFVYNNELYFFATTTNEGKELWKTNGTGPGTELVKDINAGTGGSFSPNTPYYIYSDVLYFTAVGTEGLELWKTNGTNVGTMLVKDINAGNGSSSPIFYQVLNNELFFTADDGSHGRELWKTDGTEDRTVMVKDIFEGSTGSGIAGIIIYNGKLLFAAADETGNAEPYISDGTTDGTMLLKEINPGPSGSDPDISNAVVMNGKLIFAATSLTTGRELFMTNGTENGTALFYDFNPGDLGSNPKIWLDRQYGTSYIGPNPIGLNERLFHGEIFFTVDLSIDLWPELWITDGTSANTRSLGAAFGGYTFGFLPYNYMYTNSAIYLLGNFELSDYEVYKATSNSFGLYAEIYPGSAESNPIFRFFVLNGKLFFTAIDGRDDDEVNASHLRDLFVIPEVVLPLPLINFSASAIKEGVRLNWSIPGEANAKSFGIEQSIDGVHFLEIGMVAANSTNPKNYEFLDKNAYQINSLSRYYRLKIKDGNGKYIYSAVVLVQFGKTLSSGMAVSPNPARNFIRINYTGTTGPAQLRLINSKGQVVKSIMIRLEAGDNQQVVNLENMAPGIYYTELISNGKSIEHIRFIKQ